MQSPSENNAFPKLIIFKKFIIIVMIELIGYQILLSSAESPLTRICNKSHNSFYHGVTIFRFIWLESMSSNITYMFLADDYLFQYQFC